MIAAANKIKKWWRARSEKARRRKEKLISRTEHALVALYQHQTHGIGFEEHIELLRTRLASMGRLERFDQDVLVQIRDDQQ